MGTEYVLTIPVIGPPSKVLISSNDRMHWRAKARLSKNWRTLAMVEARNAILRGDLPRLQRAHIRAVMTWPTSHRRDVGNFSPTLKAIVDGLVDAGLLPDDDDTHLEGPDLRRNPSRGPASIRLEVTDLD